MLVQRRRNSRAALRLMRKLLKKQGFAAKLLVTDKLRSYASAFRRLRLNCRMSRGCAKTIAPKTRIKRCDDRSAECNGSSRLAPPSRSSACTPPSTTPSTSSTISSRARRCGSSAPSRRTDGAMRSRPRDRASSVGLRDGCKYVSTQPRSLADGNRKSPFPSSAREAGGVANGRSGPEAAARALLRKRPVQVRKLKFGRGLTAGLRLQKCPVATTRPSAPPRRAAKHAEAPPPDGQQWDALRQRLRALLAHGVSEGEIAAGLALAPSTIRRHIERAAAAGCPNHPARRGVVDRARGQCFP
jgi:hypothetical protein